MNNKHINAARLDIWVQLQVLEDAARNARLSTAEGSAQV